MALGCLLGYAVPASLDDLGQLREQLDSLVRRQEHHQCAHEKLRVDVEGEGLL